MKKNDLKLKSVMRNVKRFLESQTFMVLSVLCLFLFVCGNMDTFAQDAGEAGRRGLESASQAITSYFDPLKKLIYAIAAVIGLIGAVKVYSKFSQGDHDTSKTAASWGGACVFLVVAATVLGAFFSH